MKMMLFLVSLFAALILGTPAAKAQQPLSLEGVDGESKYYQVWGYRDLVGVLLYNKKNTMVEITAPPGVTFVPEGPEVLLFSTIPSTNEVRITARLRTALSAQDNVLRLALPPQMFGRWGFWRLQGPPGPHEIQVLVRSRDQTIRTHNHTLQLGGRSVRPPALPPAIIELSPAAHEGWGVTMAEVTTTATGNFTLSKSGNLSFLEKPFETRVIAPRGTVPQGEINFVARVATTKEPRESGWMHPIAWSGLICPPSVGAEWKKTPTNTTPLPGGGVKTPLPWVGPMALVGLAAILLPLWLRWPNVKTYQNGQLVKKSYVKPELTTLISIPAAQAASAHILPRLTRKLPESAEICLVRTDDPDRILDSFSLSGHEAKDLMQIRASGLVAHVEENGTVKWGVGISK